MVRHEYVTPYIKGVFVSSGINRFGKPATYAIAPQKWLVAKAGERQEMRMAFDIPTFALFALRESRMHDRDDIGRTKWNQLSVGKSMPFRFAE